MLRDEGTDKFSFNKAWYLYRERRIVMVKRNIVLGNVANVQEFNRICGHMDFDVDLAQGKYLPGSTGRRSKPEERFWQKALRQMRFYILR